MPRRNVPTVLKLIRGTQGTEPLKNDAPKIDEAPVIPPGTVLTDEEQAMFEYLLTHVYVPGVHGTGDGVAFVKLARLYVRANAADGRVAETGPVMKNPQTGKPELSPYARLSRDTWQQIGVTLNEIGGTPSGRAKIGGPRVNPAGEPASWDEID